MSIKILNNEYYFYTDPIGYGSFSTIFKGANYSDGSIIAVKKINKIIDKRHFNNEIQLMKTLSHTNIIKLHDVIYKTKREIYLVLDYCNGGDLSYYIESGSRMYDNKYFYEILTALEYLFNKEILHRDIKPENILIHDNVIKISDFGFAKSFEKNELITTFCGSPLYMAPEIIINKEYNYSSDIWSLGVVLYELLQKIHPYPCNNRDELWKKIKNKELNIDFTEIGSLNKRKVLTRLLEFDYKTRITWKKLFKEVFDIRNRSHSFNNDHPVELTRSVCIPKNPKQNLASSICYSNTIEIINYDDCEVVSNSAPNLLGSYYMKKYIKGVGTPPENDRLLESGPVHCKPNASFTNYLTKSVSTLKGFFSN
tara:strand:- start:730 stop:1833 length:1104 start_codon:yes stop_codon:yes gene_type:complete